jgi:hypothetical protein
MYLRTIQRHNKDGSTVRYVQLAHNHRKGRSTQAEVLLQLGREDRLDMEGLRRLVGSISRYLDGAGALGPTGPEAALAVQSSRTLGSVWLLEGLWQRLGVADALGGVLGTRRFTTAVERVLFALVANRATDPMSKLSAAEWASQDAAIPRLAGMDDDQAYRAMDLLVEADIQARVQEAVFFAAAHLLNLEVDLLFFDTTSTFFQRDTEDDSADGFRRFGHSKDHRPDLPQVVIGLAVTREGIPVRCWCWPGNTNDMTVLQQVKDDLRGWRLGRVVTVVDRGFASDDNLAYLTRAGGHWIAGERLRDNTADVAQVLSRQGRYQSVRDNLRVKEVRVGQGDGARRFVLCHTPTRLTVTAPSASSNWPWSRPSWSASPGCAPRPPPRRVSARAAAATEGPAIISRPSAPCVTTRPWVAGCGRPRRAAGCRPRQGHGRGPAGRQVPAVHQRS